uniref:Uncharacterized protein n=1 Tax=Globodera rostochiensis TaxID=31243 RepID=A0A914H0C1_GLORO
MTEWRRPTANGKKRTAQTNSEQPFILRTGVFNSKRKGTEVSAKETEQYTHTNNQITSSSMWSSPVLLSISTIFALLGFTLMLLAGGSDNWLEYQVDRHLLAVHKSELGPKYVKEVNTDPLFYSRQYGLLHICFPDLVPNEIGSYVWFGQVCIANADYWPSSNITQRYNANQIRRLWFLRGVHILFGIGLLLSAFALLVGICGCCWRSAKLIFWTSLMFLFAVLLLIGAMLLWHFVNYMDRKVIEVYPFYMDWPKALKSATQISFGWSYVTAWAGIGFLVFTALFLYFSQRAIRDEENEQYEQKHAAYFQQYYQQQQQSDKSLVPFGAGAAAGVYPPYYGTYTGGAYGGYPSGAYYGQYASPYALYGGYYAPV